MEYHNKFLEDAKYFVYCRQCIMCIYVFLHFCICCNVFYLSAKMYLIQAVLCTLFMCCNGFRQMLQFSAHMFLVCRMKCGHLSTLELKQRQHANAQKAMFTADGLAYKSDS